MPLDLEDSPRRWVRGGIGVRSVGSPGVSAESWAMIWRPRSFFPSGERSSPSLDLGEGALGPAVDGGEEADEEVDGQGAEVDLVLERGPAVQELLLDGAAEGQHLLGVVADLLKVVMICSLVPSGAMNSRIIASKSIANGDTGVASHSRSTWRPASVIEYRPRPPPHARAPAATSPMASSRLTSR